MTGPEGKSPKRKKRRWLKRFLIAASLALAALLASPFIFTTALARYAIRRSAYRDLPLTFSSASLSPAGALTLHNVVLTDQDNFKGKPLLSAGTVRFDFGWRDVWSSHVRIIAVEDADIVLRQGKETPLTLLRLFNSPSPSPRRSEPATTSAAVATDHPGGGFLLDQLLIVGRVRFEGFDQWTRAVPLRSDESIPVQLAMTSRTGPTYTVSITAGEPDTATRPALKGRLAIRNTSAGTVIAAELLTLQNLQLVIPESLLSQISLLPVGIRNTPPARIEQITLSGSATISKETTLNVAVDVRNLSQRLQRSGVPVTSPIASIENLSASTRITGKLSDNPLRDLAFASARCSWDVAQAGEYRFEHGVADFDISATEIVLKDLQTTLFDTPLALSGAWDMHARVISRARLWYNNFSAPLLLGHLPPSIRRQFPGELDGVLSARVFLTESDNEHIAAHVELACDEQLDYFLNRTLGSTTATQPIHAGVAPDLAISKSELSGTVSWNYHLDSLPEISHGRFIADALTVASPHPDQGVDLSNIKSDFTLGSGIVRIIDCYADLAGDGQLSAFGTYALASGSLEQASIMVQDAEASMLDPWVPGKMSGTFTATLEGKGNREKAEATLSLGLSPQMSFSALGDKAGSLTIDGTATQTIGMKLFLDTTAQSLRLTDVTLNDAGLIHADANFITWLSTRIASANPNATILFDAMKKGFTLLPGDMALSGTLGWGPGGQIAGAIFLAGLDARAESDGQPLSLSKFSGKTDFVIPWQVARLEQIRIDNADFHAAALSFSDRRLADLALAGTVKDGRITLRSLAAVFDEGKMTGDGYFTTNADDILHLKFKGLNQRLLTRTLYPDVFTAEGLISGSLTLSRATTENTFTGEIHLAADVPGRLLISREASGKTIAPIAKAAVENESGALLPDNFDQIVSDQLANFPYDTGRAILRDDNGKLLVTLYYDRIPLKPGDPGYSVPVTIAGQKVMANLEFNLAGTTFTLPKSVTNIVSDILRPQHNLQKSRP